MDKYCGLRFLICVAAVALQFQVSNAGVMRTKELTNSSPTEAPSVTETLPSEDQLIPTTLPSILFRANSFRSIGDNTGASTEEVPSSSIGDNTGTSTEEVPSSSIEDLPEGKKIFPQLPRSSLPRTESPLGSESTLASTSSVGSDTSLVPTPELVRVSSVSSDRPDMGILAGNDVGVKSSAKNSNEKRTMEILGRDDGIITERTVPLPPQSDLGSRENITTVNSKDDALSEANEELHKTDVKREELATYLASVQVFPKEPKFSDSFIPPAVQILAYAIDELWVTEKRTWDQKEEKNPLFNSEPLKTVTPKGDSTEEEKILPKEKKIIEDTEDDDDASSRPVFQTNVPIVNSESVPMKMTMDIIPVDHPEDFDDFPIQYPTDLADYGDDMYNDSKLEDDILATGSLNNKLQYSGQIFAHPWGKDYADEDGFTDLVSRYPEDIERDVEERLDLLSRLQERTQIFKYSATFESLVKLHKDLAAYVRNHNVRKYKGYSDNVSEVLQKTSSGTVAEQLKIVLGKILEYSTVDDASLQRSLEDLFNKLSNLNSEESITLRRIPALRYV